MTRSVSARIRARTTNGSCHSTGESNTHTWVKPFASARLARSTTRRAGGSVCNTTPKSMIPLPSTALHQRPMPSFAPAFPMPGWRASPVPTDRQRISARYQPPPAGAGSFPKRPLPGRIARVTPGSPGPQAAARWWSAVPSPANESGWPEPSNRSEWNAETSPGNGAHRRWLRRGGNVAERQSGPHYSPPWSSRTRRRTVSRAWRPADRRYNRHRRERGAGTATCPAPNRKFPPCLETRLHASISRYSNRPGPDAES